MKKICITLLMTLSVIYSFSQLSKKDRASFINSLSASICEDTAIRSRLYTCMGKAFPEDNAQALEIRLNDLEKENVDRMLFEVMKSFSLNRNLILPYFDYIGKNPEVSRSWYDHLTKKFNKDILDLHEHSYNEYLDKKIQHGIDTAYYYESVPGSSEMTSLLLRKNGSVTIWHYPRSSPADSAKVIGKWTRDTVFHFYFNHHDGGIINRLFNRGITDNPFKIITIPQGLVVTTVADITQFNMLDNTCMVKLKKIKPDKPQATTSKVSDTSRLYESTSAYTAGQLKILLKNNNTVSVSFIPADKQSDSTYFVGAWRIDSELRLRFSDKLTEQLNSIFTTGNGKKHSYKTITEKGFTWIYINPKDTVLTLMNGQCEAITKTNNLSIQIPASFRGGQANWLEFIRKHTNGDIPIEKGAPRGIYTVTVSFLINEYGKVMDIRALNNPGYGCKEEAERVISLSPDWTPASINGKNVTFRQKQQFKFQVSEGGNGSRLEIDKYYPD